MSYSKIEIELSFKAKEYFCFFNGENVFLLLDSVSSVKNGETIYIYKRKEVENENKFFSMKRVKKICSDK